MWPAHNQKHCLCAQSFWAFSEKKLGYSGVATYVKDEWSPVSVEVDSLGTLDAGLNGEGRCAASLCPLQGSTRKNEQQ